MIKVKALDPRVSYQDYQAESPLVKDIYTRFPNQPPWPEQSRQLETSASAANADGAPFFLYRSSGLESSFHRLKRAQARAKALQEAQNRAEIRDLQAEREEVRRLELNYFHNIWKLFVHKSEKSIERAEVFAELHRGAAVWRQLLRGLSDEERLRYFEEQRHFYQQLYHQKQLLAFRGREVGSGGLSLASVLADLPYTGHPVTLLYALRQVEAAILHRHAAKFLEQMLGDPGILAMILGAVPRPGKEDFLEAQKQKKEDLRELNQENLAKRQSDRIQAWQAYQEQQKFKVAAFKQDWEAAQFEPNLSFSFMTSNQSQALRTLKESGANGLVHNLERVRQAELKRHIGNLLSGGGSLMQVLLSPLVIMFSYPEYQQLVLEAREKDNETSLRDAKWEELNLIKT